MLRELIEDLLNKALEERKDLFLIDFQALPNNDYKVVIDGDKGVQVEDCVFVSSEIEHNIGRDEHDFSLEVTSAGATSPLTEKRQYSKNIGRTLEIKTKDNQNLEGKLTEVNEESITLEWRTREPKPVGKGKVTVRKKVEVAFEDIDTARVKIIF
ncbi:MAG: ribosome assembly cofactor RimP [Flavobacteriaceae bacterium]|nr:ribosome assembly cofactor RimP [Flavobacteriaceae bacterium]